MNDLKHPSEIASINNGIPSSSRALTRDEPPVEEPFRRFAVSTTL